MELVIEGNKASYRQAQHVMRGVFRLVGRPNEAMTLYMDSGSLSFRTPHVFNEFSKAIKGGSPSAISLTLSEIRLIDNLDAVTAFAKKSFTELNLFKAVFLIYDWVEIAYTDAYAVSLGSKIYNEFIVDFNSAPGPQEDIYFIQQELIGENNALLLEHLIDINLLSSATFSGGNLGTIKAISFLWTNQACSGKTLSMCMILPVTGPIICGRKF